MVERINDGEGSVTARYACVLVPNGETARGRPNCGNKLSDEDGEMHSPRGSNDG